MARPPILSVALPSDTGRVLSIQSHTVQVQPAALTTCDHPSVCWVPACTPR
ncbi:Pyridoxal kinase [Zea mays]|uniref:Pyridoxal kinase n=1 Tax=Zea mays TaxID=4577 RepID=A0A1D6MVV7_MAIZE|nr:Pyridoxal kinase [Zea mays]ONM32940.1 Pyridoxal kinase [Zea mays]ONM32941.1 Pyridoxal kinase [Zea mays]